jgi:hypothetical protein
MIHCKYCQRDYLESRHKKSCPHDIIPRQLRDCLKRGEMTAEDPRIWKVPPEPPTELSPFLYKRMRVSIRAAMLFLSGKQLEEIGRMLEREGLLQKKRMASQGNGGMIISKARVAQYVDKGTKFMMDRRYFRAVTVKGC